MTSIELTEEQREAIALAWIKEQRLVAHFKNEPGSICLHAPADTDCGQDYEYHVYANTFKPEEGVRLECIDGRQRIFSGTPEEFLQFSEE